MRFSLNSSPFKNIHKFTNKEDFFPYIESKLRSLLWSYRRDKRMSFPPSTLVVSPSEGSFLFGWSYSTTSSFIEASRYEARLISADLAILLAEVTSLSSPDTSFLVVELQKANSSSLRSLMRVQEPGWVEEASYHEISDIDGMDPIDRDILLSSYESNVIGISSMFERILPEPCT